MKKRWRDDEIHSLAIASDLMEQDQTGPDRTGPALRRDFISASQSASQSASRPTIKIFFIIKRSKDIHI